MAHALLSTAQLECNHATSRVSDAQSSTVARRRRRRPNSCDSRTPAIPWRWRSKPRWIIISHAHDRGAYLAGVGAGVGAGEAWDQTLDARPASPAAIAAQRRLAGVPPACGLGDSRIERGIVFARLADADRLDGTSRREGRATRVPGSSNQPSSRTSPGAWRRETVAPDTVCVAVADGVRNVAVVSAAPFTDSKPRERLRRDRVSARMFCGGAADGAARVRVLVAGN